MDELALINKLKSLEASWASLDSWLKFWIFLVVVGVVVELVVVLIEYSRELHEFRRGVIRPPDKPSTWLLIFGLLGAGFVAIGVAGEFGIQIKAGKVETDMRDATFALVAIANGKAEAAGERASNANERASNANERVTKANGRIENLRKANNEAAAKLEEEKRKRLELAASLLPRDFWDQSGAIATLSAFPPPASVVFEYLDEQEVIGMAEQINFVAIMLHWKTGRSPGHKMLIKKDGITILPARHFPTLSPDRNVGIKQLEQWERERSATTALCEAFKKALQDSGLDAEVEEGTGTLPAGTILVSVGSKPNHAVEEAIKELAKPAPPTPLPMGGSSTATMGGNRFPIPEIVTTPPKIP